MSSVENYGRFIDNENCFELLDEPPRKWRNVHYNKIGSVEIYCEASNIGDGPTWIRDENGVTCNLVSWDSKYAYIRDDDSGTVFCPWGAPAPKEVEKRTCRYYASRTEISGSCEKLKATQRIFVPHDHPVEIWTLKVENLSDSPRNISVFAYAMFQLTGCDAEGKYVGKDNYSEVIPEIGGVLITNRNRFVPTDRFKGYLIALNNFHAGNGYRDQFTRSEFSLGTPKILWGWNCDNRGYYGPDCAGVVQVKLRIEAKSSGRADFIIGQAASVGEVSRMRGGFSEEKIDLLCGEQEEIERDRAGKFTVSTGVKNYDSLINIFVKKQLYSYLINKSGFRDNLQADYAISMFDYKVAEENFLRALSFQDSVGKVPHGFRPLNRMQYSDKPAWILLLVPELVKEGGDFSLLEKELPYFESGEKGSVWDHVKRTYRFMAADLGGNGLSDQHHADWNDGLEATKEAGARESIMVSQQLCYGLREIAGLADEIGDAEVKEECESLYGEFKRRINELAWDGEWYIRTICGDGYKIGSKNNREGKIFLNTQSWAVISGVAEGERARICMESVDRHIEADIGYRICAPGFSEYDPRVGRMSNSIPGHMENGGCYNHAAGFKGVADCILGRAEKAWETFVKVAPDNPLNRVSISGGEPFSFNNSYSMCEHVYGSAGYPWRTGTAGWMTVLLVEWILGARRSYDGLLIDPCLSRKIRHAKVFRTFRGTGFDIELDNAAGRCKGAEEILLDGSRIDGNILTCMDGGRHEVKVKI